MTQQQILVIDTDLQLRNALIEYDVSVNSIARYYPWDPSTNYSRTNPLTRQRVSLQPNLV